MVPASQSQGIPGPPRRRGRSPQSRHFLKSKGLRLLLRPGPHLPPPRQNGRKPQSLGLLHPPRQGNQRHRRNAPQPARSLHGASPAAEPAKLSVTVAPNPSSHAPLAPALYPTSAPAKPGLSPTQPHRNRRPTPKPRTSTASRNRSPARPGQSRHAASRFSSARHHSPAGGRLCREHQPPHPSSSVKSAFGGRQNDS